ncbi:MAG: hypothetical protein RR482_05235, partial [Clostridia bacterium]
MADDFGKFYAGGSGGQITADQLYKSMQVPKTKQRTEEELRKAAENRVGAAYEQNVQAAKQQQERQDLALSQQAEALKPTYAQRAEEARKQTAQISSQTNNQALSRGMQRSSYNNANQINIGLAGAKTQDDIGKELTTGLGNIQGQRAQLAQQLAQQLATLDTGKTTSVNAYMDELQSQDLANAMQTAQMHNSLLLQLKELGLTGEALGFAKPVYVPGTSSSHDGGFTYDAPAANPSP